MKSLDERKTKTRPFEMEPLKPHHIQPQVNSSNVESSAPSQLFNDNNDRAKPGKPVTPPKPFVHSKPAVASKPLVPSKPVSPNKPVSPSKPVSPNKPVSPTKTITTGIPVFPPKPVSPNEHASPSKPELVHKPVSPKPVIPVKPVSKKTPPPPKPKTFKIDTNNNKGSRGTGTPPRQSDGESVSLNHIDAQTKEELTREVPQGFSNIVSAFETSSKNGAVTYAVPDMTKKSPRQPEKRPEVPPKIYTSASPSTETSGRTPSPNKASVLTPPPIGASARIPSPQESSIPAASPTRPIAQTPSPKEFISTPSAKPSYVRTPSPSDPSIRTPSPKGSIVPELSQDSPRDVLPDSPYEDPGPPDFKPPPPPFQQIPHQREEVADLGVSQEKTSNFKPPTLNTPPPPGVLGNELCLPSKGNSPQERRISPPPDFKSELSEKLSHELLAPKVVDKSYSSVDVVSSIPRKPLRLANSEYEEVIPRGPLPKRSPHKNSTGTPPPKPPPYNANKGNASAQCNGSTGTPPQKPLPYNSGTDMAVPPPYKSNTGIPLPPEDWTSDDDPVVVSSPRYPLSGSPRLSSAQLVSNALRNSRSTTPPTPPRRTSSSTSPVPLSPRDTGKPPPPPRTTSMKDASMNIDDIIARALSPDMKPNYDLDDIPVRDTGPAIAPPPTFGHDAVSPFDIPPSPPHEPPPSLPIDSYSYDLPSPSSEHVTRPRVNGYSGEWDDDDDDLMLTPPLPPSNKYGLSDGRMKPLVPPLRKHR